MTKSVAIMQPYFFPYLGYFSLMSAVDVFVLYTDVQYVRRGWMNRNRILDRTKKDGWRYVGVPTMKAPQKTLFSDIEIMNSEDWKANFYNQLQACYRRAPYFKSLLTEIRGWLRNEDHKLCELNVNLLKFMWKKLEYKKEVIDSSTLTYDRTAEKEKKLMQITESLGAHVYVNAAGGTELYSKGNWKKNGIELRFVKTKGSTYAQGDEPFISNLSIIDTLMWNDVQKTRRMIDDYILI